MSLVHRREQHVNSLLAYFEGQEEWFGKREIQVLSALKKLGRASDREIMLHLNYSDMNAVRPRLTELIEEGLIYQVGDQQDPMTGKTVRILQLVRDPRLPQREFEFIIQEKSA